MRTTFLKNTLAAAAVLMAATAHASTPAWDFVSASGSFTMSQEVLNASGLFVMTEGEGNKASYVEGLNSSTINLQFTSGLIVDGMLRSLVSTGAQVTMERTLVGSKVVYLDRLFTLSDFVFDLGTSTLSANMKSQDLLMGTTVDYGFNPLFTAEAVVGGTIVASPGGHAGTASAFTVGPLTITPSASDKMLLSMGLLNSQASKALPDLWRQANWGTVNVNSTVVAVPEPSSAYLGALGGIAILGVARLRQNQKGRLPS